MKFIYQSIEYFSEQAVRKAIFERERKVLGKPQSESVVEFWAKHGVTLATEEVPLDSLKLQKKMQVKTVFNSWLSDSTLQSSLGFAIDANESARNSIGDLIDVLRDNEIVSFRDADNEYHDVTVEQLRVLKEEIAKNNIFAHEQKWSFERQIENAQDKNALDCIRIKFTGKAFS